MSDSSDQAPPEARWTIDELAQLANIPTRTVREYQRLGVLAPPRRQGRIGIYERDHLTRLNLIARLQRRGYSLAGIRDLLDAWTSGATLDSVIGDHGFDELAQRFTPDQLGERARWIIDPTLQAMAINAGLIRVVGDTWVVRAPSLLALIDDAIAMGADPAAAITVASAVRDAAHVQARTIAALFTNDLWKRADRNDLERFGRRSRINAAQAAAALIVDALGEAITNTAHERDDTELAEFAEAMSLRRVNG